MVLIEFESTDDKNTILLSKFYRESTNTPGSGKTQLFQAFMNLPSHIKYVNVDASGGKDEVNTRKGLRKLFTRDTRTFSSYTKDQMYQWMIKHDVNPSFINYVLSLKSVKDSRYWLRILSSNEKLVEYYEKLGFKKENKWLAPTVHMKLKIR